MDQRANRRIGAHTAITMARIQPNTAFLVERRKANQYAQRFANTYF